MVLDNENSSGAASSAVNGGQQPLTGTEAPLIDLSDNDDAKHTGATTQPNELSSDDDDNADNISLGSVSVDSELTSSTLPPTYDLASILRAQQQNSVGATNDPHSSEVPSNGGGGAASHLPSLSSNGRSLAPLTNNGVRMPGGLPSTEEMENMPSDVVALILETLTILELYDLHSLSERWRPFTTRALLDKFRKSHIVLWIDQEAHRAFRPLFLFDSFDEATNRIRWLPRPTAKPEGLGQVYSKTFGITKPVLRVISVGEVDKYDYLDKEATINVHKPGTRTILGSDKGCPWAFIYKVSKFTRKGKRIHGERWVEPISFECHLDFLNPRRAHKLRLLWYLQKTYSNVPLVGSAVHKAANRSKVEGQVAPSQMSEYFQGHYQETPSAHIGTFP
ncbi:hypothetical protein BGW42_006021 [Actinomortierella wolfii]|nr:hypothetical protein BGW42_006021 [Actinomortierella wolfii]